MANTTSELTTLAQALAPDFVLDREIGRGGMGVVYHGVDARLERPVAIKVLPEPLEALPEVRERFLREARTAARLSHPNIVPIYRADELRGVVFIVMAYVEGESLAERLVRRGTLEPGELVPILRDVASALDHAHAHGIVHRDIKPENILIDHETGRALVTDFGIARLAEAKPLTATGQLLGTVYYMSPEQISGERVDGRTDLYSLAVVAFRALTGQFPFDNESASAVLVAHVVKAPPKVRDVSPQVPRALAEVIDRSLAKDPAARCGADGALASLFEQARVDVGEGPGATAVTPVLSEREAHAIWSRAAELQMMTGVQERPAAPPVLEATNVSDRRSATSGYKFSDVRDAAIEAGIPERYVARAAAELGVAGAAPNDWEASLAVRDETPSASPWAGAPMSIVYEMQIPGEIPESELYLLVETIRRRVGEAGHVGSIGRSVSWSSDSRHRRIQVSIVPRAGKTTIRIDERLGQLAGGLYGGIVGGAGGGSCGLAFALGMSFHSVGMSFGLWGVGITGTYLLARTIFTTQAQRRTVALRALITELADEARDLIRTLPRAT
jgi:eukaryotic-like serine/threonine-protein kinase